MATPTLHTRNENFGERLNAGCTAESPARLLKNPGIHDSASAAGRLEPVGSMSRPSPQGRQGVGPGRVPRCADAESQVLAEEPVHGDSRAGSASSPEFRGPCDVSMLGSAGRP